MEQLSDERLNRYRSKLDRLSERLEDLDMWSRDLEVLLSSKKDRRAVKKTFQEAVEAVTDICAMYLSDEGMAVADDSTNIGKASEKLFESELENKLIEANGLRNRVVHDYGSFDDKKGLKSLENLIEPLESFESEVRQWTNKK